MTLQIICSFLTLFIMAVLVWLITGGIKKQSEIIEPEPTIRKIDYCGCQTKILDRSANKLQCKTCGKEIHI